MVKPVAKSLRGRIVVGATVGQDFRSYIWPNVRGVSASNEDMVFDVEQVDAGWVCRANGFGVLDGALGSYGNGALYVRSVADVAPVLETPTLAERLAELAARLPPAAKPQGVVMPDYFGRGRGMSEIDKELDSLRSRATALELALTGSAAAPAVEQDGLGLDASEISEVWDKMPGGPSGWLKEFGYQQFAEAILEAQRQKTMRTVPTTQEWTTDGQGIIRSSSGALEVWCYCQSHSTQTSSLDSNLADYVAEALNDYTPPE